MMNTKGKLLILILCISFIVFPGCYGTADIEANEIVREDEQSGPPVREHIVESESASEPESFEADEPEEKDDEYEYAYGTHQIRGCLSESSGKILTVDFKYNEIEYPYDAGSPLMAEYIISAEILMDQKPYHTRPLHLKHLHGREKTDLRKPCSRNGNWRTSTLMDTLIFCVCPAQA